MEVFTTGSWPGRDLPGEPLGVCFQAQIVPEIPREAHDAHVEAVVTEPGCFEAGRTKRCDRVRTHGGRSLRYSSV